MDTLLKRRIVRSRQMRKFCLYGFLKNLRFFEPFLLIFLMANQVSLFEIGILYAVREGTILLLAIPTGILADAYGRKRELMSCFVFYLVSFLIFYTGTSFPAFLGAMVFFGAGEAFRTGTHKSMIFSWIDREGFRPERTFIYARTRSFSLLGGAASGLFGALILLVAPEMRWVFVATMLPYLLNMALISTYPDWMNGPAGGRGTRWLFQEGKRNLTDILQSPKIRRPLLNSGIYEGVFRTIRDYIQPILEGILIGAALQGTMDAGRPLDLLLGFGYFGFYLASAVGARNAYRSKERWGAKATSNRIFLLLGVLCLLISRVSHYSLPVLFLFLLLFVASHVRRPLMVAILGGVTPEHERATLFSLESQTKSACIVVLAPLVGWVAEYRSIGTMFFLLGLGVVLLAFAVRIPNRRSRFL